MNFSVLPPEVDSLRMFVGAGSGPMLTAAAARGGLGSELGTGNVGTHNTGTNEVGLHF
jgi:PPE-repeat protein